MDPMDGDPEAYEEHDNTVRTRNGYAVADAVRGFRVSLEQTGAAAAGKSLHYTADLVCSGCFELWQKILYEYALDHIGIASPRIFLFLRRRFLDLDGAYARLPAEEFYKNVEYQKIIAETLLVMRSCTRRPALKMPKVPAEAHNEEWVIAATATTPSSAAVGRVYRGGNDLAMLRRIGDEFSKACADGATERAFFWLKWCYEEESRIRRDGGGQMSTLERGPATWSGKQRTHVGFYLMMLLAELYKEFKPKHGLRMDEEFMAILNLYGHPDRRLTAKRRMDLLCLAIQIVCEVPRWKVPAAPSLVKDPVALERAVSHAEGFFREVLQFAPPSGDVVKEARRGVKTANPINKVMTTKQKHEMGLQEHLAAYDTAINNFLMGKQ
jgi:hypothetical protein